MSGPRAASAGLAPAGSADAGGDGLTAVTGAGPDGGPDSGPAAGLAVAGTEPYPWPWDGRFSPRRCALLAVTDGTAIGDASVARLVAALTAQAAGSGVLVVRVLTGRPSRGGAGGDGLTGPRPAGWRAEAGWRAVTAAGWDGFYGSPLDALLRGAGRDQVLLAGRLLETGVHSTLRSANDRGYECLTVGDACEAGSPATRRGALSSITMSGGIFGATGTAAGVLALLRAGGSAAAARAGAAAGSSLSEGI